MLEVSLSLKKLNSDKYNYFIELTSKTALESNDIEFAWKTAMLVSL
jgi:hypothetical protein